MGGLIKVCRYEIPHIFNIIRGNHHQLYLDGTPGKITVSSDRLRMFLNGVKCVNCGTEGTHFYSCISSGSKLPIYHLNLYTDKDELITKDHILPRSQGGPDTFDNLQPMCEQCNSKKGDTIPEKLPNHLYKYVREKKLEVIYAKGEIKVFLR
jgi:5-methylcytosine-specific restriction endonuclease McrA